MQVIFKTNKMHFNKKYKALEVRYYRIALIALPFKSLGSVRI